MPLRDGLHRYLRGLITAALAVVVLLAGVDTGSAARRRQAGKPAVAQKPPPQVASKKKARAKTKKKRRTTRARRPADPAKLIMPATAEDHPVLDHAAQFLGRPYRFGAAGEAYDCSGFVRTVFAEFGIDLPHSARDQFAHGDSVPREALQPGDLVFFRTYRRDASHVGIYCGDDKFIHATSAGGRVQVDSLNKPYYTTRYLGGRRLDPNG